MASQKTIETRDSLRGAAEALERKIKESVERHYPGLLQYTARRPGPFRLAVTGTGPDDFAWVSWGGYHREIAALRAYMGRAVGVTAARISEAYGMGEGERWAATFAVEGAS